MFEWGIESLTFSSGEEITVEPASTFIIIGPNNSGKSTALREITFLSNNQLTATQVIKSLKRFVKGDESEFTTWLTDNFSSFINQGIRYFISKNDVIIESSVGAIWKDLKHKTEITTLTQSDGLLAYHFLIHHLDTTSRLSLIASVPSKNAFDNPSQYIHVLQMNEELRNKISIQVRKAFQKDLIINWGGGNRVWFHVGDEPDRTAQRDRVSLEYLEELQEVPRLEDEGDGIRSFVGTLLACHCGTQPVLLIDEPEVFLHPPQIRRLAEIIAKNAEERKRQVIMATHSSEVVQGALSASSRVAICRITREGKVNHATLLSQSQIEELWSKPLLRSAAAIDGVFHEGVIVSEADSDSRIYEAILRQIENEGRIQSPNDFYFVQGGGKGELATIAKVYVTLGVKTAVIADFDILRQRGEFEKLYSSLGGDFNSIETKYNATACALSKIGPRLLLPDFVAEVRRSLDSLEVEANQLNTETETLLKLSSEHRKYFSKLLEDTGDWSEAKKYGIAKLKGGAFQTCAELLEECARIGLFIVPYGELESWWRGGPAIKNEWFVEAISEISRNPSSFKEAGDFIARICQHLNSSNSKI